MTVNKYQDLMREKRRICNIRFAKVVPVIVGALGSSTEKKLKNCINELGVSISTTLIQKITLLRTARVLLRVLESYGERKRRFKKKKRRKKKKRKRKKKKEDGDRFLKGGVKGGEGQYTHKPLAICCGWLCGQISV